MSKSRLVYSSEYGRICSQCGSPVSLCECKKKKQNENVFTGKVTRSGTVRITLESKGRKGKTVTVITGIPIENSGLKELAKKLKTLCGSGGSVKDGAIIIQGDHRQTAMTEIKKQGYDVKLA